MPPPGLTGRVPLALGALVLVVSAAACASSNAVPHPFPMPGAQSSRDPKRQERPSHSTVVPAQAVVATALAFRGVPYRDGGSGPDGFDCSGFTQYVFARHGVVLGRSVRDQFEQGKEIKKADLAPGDLVFFATTGRGPTHVAIVVGDSQFVHAPSSTGVVRVERLGAAYWSRRYIGARRLRREP